MREGYKQSKLGKTSSHRKALLSNLAVALFRYEFIKTTEAKAKALRPFAEKLITKARRGGLANIRYVGRDIKDKEVLKKLFDEIGPRYKDRTGGYIRLYKLGYRSGDRARMNYVELVDRVVTHSNKSKGKKEKKKSVVS